MGAWAGGVNGNAKHGSSGSVRTDEREVHGSTDEEKRDRSSASSTFSSMSRVRARFRAFAPRADEKKKKEEFKHLFLLLLQITPQH